jgi:hypothetical protein
VRPDARMRPGPSVRFKSIDTERLLRFLRSDSVGDSIPRSLLPTRSRQPTTAALSALQCRGDGRCLEMRGSRLANWLLPRDSFAERALLNRRCCEGFGRRTRGAVLQAAGIRNPSQFRKSAGLFNHFVGAAGCCARAAIGPPVRYPSRGLRGIPKDNLFGQIDEGAQARGHVAASWIIEAISGKRGRPLA